MADIVDSGIPPAQDPTLDAEFNKAFAPRTKMQATTPVQPPIASQPPINVIDPEGNIGSLPGEHLQTALDSGYQLASDEQVDQHLKQEKYGTPGQVAKTAAEGALEAGTFGLSTGVERGLGIATSEDIQGRRETNPGSHMAGQLAGLVGSAALIPGGGAAGARTKAGEMAGEAVGLGAEAAGAKAVEAAAEAAKGAGLTGKAYDASVAAAKTASQLPYNTVQKIGSAAVKGATENALFQAEDEVSKMLASNDGHFSETAIPDVGLAAVLGGVIGGGVGSISPLWKATVGDKVGGILKAIQDKAGGVEGEIKVPEVTAPTPLKGLPKGSPGPNEAVHKAARDYAETYERPIRQAEEYAPVDPARGSRIAQAFEQMQHAPKDPAVKSAYDSLIKETLDQYQTVKGMGLKIEPIKPGMENPYPDGSKQVLEDVQNGHLWYFPTDQGFGTSGAELSDHPLMAPTAESIDGKPLLANDVFRIVHDIFGHAKEGNGFGPSGEENAWQSHVRMYSPEAAKAMTTETRGQNSWVNFGPHGQFNQAFPTQTIYADQKAGLLPDWAMTDGLVADRMVKDTGNMTAQEAMDHTIATSGMTLPPEIRAGLSNDPEIQNMFKTLEQSDTTKSGRKFQESMKKFRADAGAHMAKQLGAEDVSKILEKGELDKNAIGKEMGDTLAKEWSAQVDPLSKAFDQKRARFGDQPLTPDRVTVSPPDYSNPYKPSSGVSVKEPGTISSLAEQIGMRAQEEGWMKLPDSDIARSVNKVLKALPEQKTLNDLDKLATSIGNEMQKDFIGNGPLARVGGIIKSMLREAEADVIGQKLGTQAPEQLAKFQAERQAYAAQAKLKDLLDSRIHAGGSTSGYSKALKEFVGTGGAEDLVRRISGVGDADMLKLLQEQFPNTAALVKKYHINNVLAAAKDGDVIKGERLIKALYNPAQMSPQLREFIADPNAMSKINAVGQMLDQFNKAPHNFSNTGRTIDKLFQFLPGSAMGMVAMLTGHNPITAAIVGGLTRALSKDVPDATRLALLKFMGSSAPIESTAFKATVDAINSTIKGENLVTKAAQNVFKAGKEVLPASSRVSKEDIEKLNKSLKKLQDNPRPLEDVATGVQHYMPEHGAALGQIASRAVNYLNNLRPDRSPKAPLDPKIIPSDVEKSDFNRALKVAQQPLTVLEKIQDGSLTPKDLVHLKALYPGLYERLAVKLTENMTEAVHKGEIIPYKTRIGLSMFLGQPLDSTLSPMGILAAQPNSAFQPKAQAQAEPMAKKSNSGLNKLPKAYQTPNQAAESDRGKRSD